EERRTAIDEDDRPEEWRDPIGTGETRHVVPEQVGEHRTEEDDRYGQHDAEPELVTELRGVVAMPTVSRVSAVIVTVVSGVPVVSGVLGDEVAGVVVVLPHGSFIPLGGI